jgi:hypothetical protein
VCLVPRPFRGKIELDNQGAHHRRADDAHVDVERHFAAAMARDRGGVGKGGTAALYIDGVAAGEGRIEQTEAFLFSADETCDVGNEFGSPVTTDDSKKKFSGEVNWVEIEFGGDDHNHLIKPEDRLNVAMAIQ